jgi:hypothetical protein
MAGYDLMGTENLANELQPLKDSDCHYKNHGAICMAKPLRSI